MAKLQGFKRVIAEDFAEKDRAIIDKLAFVINTFGEDVVSALTKQLSVEDNLNITKKDITVTVDVLGVPTVTLNVKTDLDHACQGITVIRVTDNVTANRAPSGTPFVTFVENTTGIIKINNITNLIGNNSYTLRLLLF